MQTFKRPFFHCAACRRFSQPGVLSLLTLISMTSWSSELVEEVLVTAEFRSAGVSELPASVSVLDPAAQQERLNHLEELLAQAPNLNLSSGASRARFYQIRGIGERGQFAEPLNASVALLVDGVDLSGLGTAATLFDVQQVEIFRGPQGTLYGANALAGLINVVSPEPTEQFSSTLVLDAGDYAAFGVGGIVSGPLSENSGFRLSLRQYQDDGFIDNVYLGRGDTDNHDEASVRGKLQGEFQEGRWQVIAGHVDVDNGYDAFSLDNDRRTRSDQPGKDAQESDYLGVNLERTLGQTARVELSLGGVESDIDYGYDEDWTFDGFHPYGYSSTDRYLRDVRTRTADLRLLSQQGYGIGGVIDWVLGVYALDKSVDLQRDYTWLSAPFTSRYDVNRAALYGELSGAPAPGLRLSVGLRLEQHESDYRDSEGVAYNPDDDLLGGRILLEYSPNEDAMLYTSLTRGYKSGGFNTSGTLDEDLRLYDPETLWNLEAGYKAMLLDDRLRLAASVFRMQRRDIQIATSITRVRADGSAEFIDFVGNGAEGINQGVELEISLQATDRLKLAASLGVLDTEFEDYVDGAGQDLDGRDQAQSPGYQFYVAADYQLAPAWTVNLNIEGRDEYYFSDSHAERAASYELINASIGYRSAAWSASFYARNLADQEYEVRGFYFGNDPRDDYAARGFTQLGAPRQVGLSLRLDF